MGPKKKKGKKKNVQIQIENALTYITSEENTKRIHRQDFRVEAVHENNIAFEEIRHEYEERIKLEKKQLEWEKYVTCDKIPHLDSPRDIRTYLYKWFYDEWNMIKSSFSWVLDIDERSVLTQDMHAKNLTRNALLEKVPQYGNWTGYHVANAIKMMSGMETLFQENDKNSLQFFDELCKVRNEVRNRTRASLDNLSYFILMNTEGNMNTIDSISQNYHIRTDPFEMDFWALKNVPYDFEKMGKSELDIDLESIVTTITLPLSAIYDNLVIRGIHQNFDHRSLYASSLHLPESWSTADDLKEVLIREWAIRKEIEMRKLNQMRKERMEYEEDLKAQEEEAKRLEAEMKKSKDKKDKKQKPKNPKKKKKQKFQSEPPVVMEDTYLDVESDFVKEDDDRHREHMKRLRPEMLYLGKNEVNLREYVILGGIFEFNILIKPEQRFLHSIYSNLNEIPEKLRYKTHKCDVKYEKPPIRSSQMSSKEMRKSTLVDEKQNDDIVEKNPVSEIQGDPKLDTLIKISVKLSQNLCRWGQPLLCRWAISESPLALDTKSNQIDIFAVPPPEKRSTYLTHDVELSSFEGRKQLHYLIEDYILPRMDSLHKFPDEAEEERERLAAIANELVRLQKEAELDLMEEEGDAEGEDAVSHGTQYSIPIKTKIIADSTPPKTLFPNLRKNEFLSLELKRLSTEKHLSLNRDFHESERMFLSDYLKELEELIKLRKPHFMSWAAIMEIIKKKTESSIIISPAVEERKETANLDAEKMKRKSMKRDRLKSQRLTKKSFKKISDESIEIEREPEVEAPVLAVWTDEDEVFSVDRGSWNTEFIFKHEFDVENSQVTFWTDRFGIYGFAFKRYLHLPFKYWALYPAEGGSNEAVLELWSSYAQFFITIKETGYTFSVMDGLQMHAKITEPTVDLRKLIFQMESLGINVFVKEDTSIYVKDISQKHVPLENHTYQSISCFCLRYKFGRSKWGWLAHRRVLLLKFGLPEQKSYEMDTLKVTPEECQFCTITERCTNLDQVILDYKLTDRNKKFEPELLSLLNSHTARGIKPNPKVAYGVYNLLKAVRPLTFCQ